MTNNLITKIFPSLCTWLSIFIFAGIVSAQSPDFQEIYNDFDRVYGLDADLYNGRKYFIKKPNVLGHPYWKSEKNFHGDLYISGKVYPNLQMKYELNEKYFILEYKDQHNATQSLILNSVNIDSVKLNGCTFIKNEFNEISNEFVELIFSGKYTALISHTKKFFYSTGVYTGFRYSDEVKEHFLVLGDKVFPFHGKREFLKIFPDKERKIIKRYISSNKIRIKKLQNAQFKELMEFCNVNIK